MATVITTIFYFVRPKIPEQQMITYQLGYEPTLLGLLEYYTGNCVNFGPLPGSLGYQDTISSDPLFVYRFLILS
jgi:hypothetical protein